MSPGNISMRNRIILVKKGLAYFLLAFLAATMLLPFFWMLMTSFMNELEVYSATPKFLPEHFLLSNYKEALTMLPFGRFFLNTVLISVAVVMGQLLITSMAAFSFSRLHFHGRDKIFSLYLATMMIPGIVTLIPAYLLVDSFHWLNTYWGLIIPFLNSVWGIFLLRQFFLTLPNELEDAARMDGAGAWKIYWHIVLPLSKPALATLAIFSFMGMWKEFLWPLVITNQMNMRPVEVGIALFHSIYSTNWPYQMAAAVVVMIPIVLIFFLAQRYFVRGIVLTGLKQ